MKYFKLTTGLGITLLLSILIVFMRIKFPEANLFEANFLRGINGMILCVINPILLLLWSLFLKEKDGLYVYAISMFSLRIVTGLYMVGAVLLFMVCIFPTVNSDSFKALITAFHFPTESVINGISDIIVLIVIGLIILSLTAISIFLFVLLYIIPLTGIVIELHPLFIKKNFSKNRIRIVFWSIVLFCFILILVISDSRTNLFTTTVGIIAGVLLLIAQVIGFIRGIKFLSKKKGKQEFVRLPSQTEVQLTGLARFTLFWGTILAVFTSVLYLISGKSDMDNDIFTMPFLWATPLLIIWCFSFLSKNKEQNTSTQNAKPPFNNTENNTQEGKLLINIKQ